MGWTPDQRAHARGLRLGIGRVAFDEVELARPHALHDPLPEIAAEARGMGGGHADVLVEVEEDRPRPVDAGRLHERVQELELGGAGGGDDVRLPPGMERAPEGVRGLARRPPPPSPSWWERP